MKPNRMLAPDSRIAVWRPLRLLVMLLLSLGLVVAGPVSAALAASPTQGTHASVLAFVRVSEPAVGEVPAEATETSDESDHDVQLADTGAQRTLLLTLGGLLSIGAGLTAWWVSQHSQSKH